MMPYISFILLLHVALWYWWQLTDSVILICPKSWVWPKYRLNLCYNEVWLWPKHVCFITLIACSSVSYFLLCSNESRIIRWGYPKSATKLQRPSLAHSLQDNCLLVVKYEQLGIRAHAWCSQIPTYLETRHVDGHGCKAPFFFSLSVRSASKDCDRRTEIMKNNRTMVSKVQIS